MTDAVYRDEQPIRQRFVHEVDTIVNPPQYAGGGMATPQPDIVTTGSDRWGNLGFYVTLAVAVLFILGSAVGIVALAKNDGVLVCSTDCWDTKKEIGLAEQETRRAMANSAANARAGFGNNDLKTQQSAVAPPAIHIEQTAPTHRIIQRVDPPARQSSLAPKPEPVCTAEESARSTPRPRMANAVPKWNPRRQCCDWWVPSRSA